MSTQSVKVMARPVYWLLAAAAVTAFLSLSGCKSESLGWTYMPDMSYSPAIKAQKIGSMRPPVANTIPRGFKPYPYHFLPEEAGKKLHNPLPRTKAVLARGQALFNVYCIVCHGATGQGDGPVTQAPSGNSFPRPPALTSDKIRDFPDGRLFHIMTDGQGLMPSYASQVEPEERWAIANYIRVLYRANHPTPDDLKQLEKW